MTLTNYSGNDVGQTVPLLTSRKEVPLPPPVFKQPEPNASTDVQFVVATPNLELDQPLSVHLPTDGIENQDLALARDTTISALPKPTPEVTRANSVLSSGVTALSPLPKASETTKIATIAPEGASPLLLTTSIIDQNGNVLPGPNSVVVRPDPPQIAAVPAPQPTPNTTSNKPISLATLSNNFAPMTPTEEPANAGISNSQAASVVAFLNSQNQGELLPLITTHTVKPGDSLAGLATQFYGDKDAFVHIYLANRDVLSRPDRVKVGQELRIPVVAQYQ